MFDAKEFENYLNSFMDPENDKLNYPGLRPADILLKKISLSLHKPGDPDYMLYDTGLPMFVYFKDHYIVVGYYAGFCGGDSPTRLCLKLGNHWRKNITPHYGNVEGFRNTRIIGFNKLVMDEKIDCTSKTAKSLINDYLIEHPMVEIETERDKIIGFLGDASGNVVDVAHTRSLDGRYDNWFNPAYCMFPDWPFSMFPDEIDNRQLEIVKKIKSISVLKPEE
jgi:hypothetical protein